LAATRVRRPTARERLCSGLGVLDKAGLQPRLMMLDEATSALGPELKHEMGFARELGDRIVFLERGVIVEE
jgi:ABC-type polar amino acid transport system ATPase subunit